MDSNDILKKGLAFVVGAPRSGTTWLQLMLSQSDTITTCQETHLVSSYMRSLFAAKENFRGDSRGAGLTNIISHDKYLSFCRAFAEMSLTELAQEDERSNIFLEKTPAHIYHYENIRELFPDAYFIEIVRDPRAMVASMRAVDFGNWTVPGVIANVDRWTSAVRCGQELEGATARHIRVRYEDLLSDPTGHLQRIFAFLGETPPPGEIEEWVANTAMDRLKDRSGSTRAPWTLKDEPSNFYRQGQADGWRSELTGSQVRLIEYLAGEEMAAAGYERAYPPVRWHWRPAAWRFLDALARRAEWYQKKL